MASQTLLHPAAPESRPVVDRLWQLYRHDLSEFRGTLPDEHGLFPTHELSTFFDATREGRWAHLILRDDRPAGFRLVSTRNCGSSSIYAFFVVRSQRRHGLGRESALELIAHYPGPWEIACQEANPGAARFWRHIATLAMGVRWREDRRPVPNRPDIPPDNWIVFDNSLG
jgi:predicted acetyltransferase